MQMAQYTLAVPHCRINQIRSAFSDTLFASVGLRVMNAQGGLHHDWPPQSVSLGDHEAGGVVNTNLFYSDVDVPDPTPESPDGGAIYWTFLLTNAGHQDSSVIVDALNNAANDIAGGLAGKALDPGKVGSLPFLGLAAAVIGLQALLQLLTADCDGMVASLGVAATAAELAQMTSDPANTLHQHNCPGTDSPAGCGDNSNYDVAYSITNRSLVAVPDLIGESPEAAESLTQQAGLFLSVVSSQTGGPNEAPHVDGQNPDPGAQVPPGTWIEAFVVTPVPPGHETP
jgi:hypothetical protein